MAYIGAVAPGYDPTRASVPQLDAERFSGNSSTTAFTLTRKVVSPTDIEVIVENVQQEPTTAYTVDGYTLNFTEAPSTGTNNIYVIYRNSGTSNYAYVPDGSITYAKLANNIRQFTVDNFTANGTGTTVVLSETPASANSLVVAIDGVIQTAPENFTLSGSTITFTSAPDNGSNVTVRHLGFRTTATVQALQAGSVTTTELADGSVTAAKLAAGAALPSQTSNSTYYLTTDGTNSIWKAQSALSIANTQISGNIVSSQIAPSVTLTTPLISGNLNFDANGTSGIRLTSANTITFHTAGTEDVRIDANGNVGIGTTSSTTKLELGFSNAGTTLASAPLVTLRNDSFTNGAVTGLVSQNSQGGNAVGIDFISLNQVNDASGASGGMRIWQNVAGAKSYQLSLEFGGDFRFNSGYGSAATAYGCRAWVNFNGTGTVAIRASGNVTSITDNGTGDYTVNFTTAMPDANYSPITTLKPISGAASTNGKVANIRYDTNLATGSCRVWCNSTGGAEDMDIVSVAIFR